MEPEQPTDCGRRHSVKSSELIRAKIQEANRLGEMASIRQGVRERTYLRQAEERDVVFDRGAIVLGVLVLKGDAQSLGALVLVCPTV